MNWNQHAGVAPRKAVVCLILRNTPELEVLLVRRNTSLAFMGGHHAFPGGALEKEDSDELVDGVNDPECARTVFAVVREVFEETGLLLGIGQCPTPERLREARQDLLAERSGFGQLLGELGLRIDGASFTPAGVWVTPPFAPKRFDTQYFIYQHEGEELGEILREDDEIVALDWMPPGEARRRWHRMELRLSTPVAFALRNLDVVPMPAVVPLLRDTPGNEGTIIGRYEPQCGVNIIPIPTPTLPPATHTNCVVVGEEELYVVDPSPADAEQQAHLKKHLDQLLAQGGTIAAVLLTHSHEDHMGAAEFLRDTYGAPIWAHAAADVPFTIDRELADGDVLTAKGNPEWRLRCLHTPGHAPDHLCYLEESTRTLLCGDMMANPGTILVSPEFGGDMTQYIESLEGLLDEDFVFTVPAHGLPTWGRTGKELVRELIAHRHEREAKIQAALDAGANSIKAVLEEAYDDTPREAWPLAEHQLKAHLIRMGLSLPA